MSLTSKLRKHQVILSLILLLIGAYLFILGLFGVVLKDISPQVITDLNETIGNWTYWFLVIGGFLTFVFTWYLIDRYIKLREFRGLIETNSKKKFLQNIARIEELAISLGPKYEDKVMEKEDEYNIDR